MRLLIKLLSPNKIVLNSYYFHIIQALVYDLLDDNFASWLHERGFLYKKRSFKLFSFSNILEKPKLDRVRRVFTFPRQVSFALTSPVDHILEQFAKNSVTKFKLRLGANEVYVDSVEILGENPINETKIRVQTLTPIEVHSTLESFNGKKKTYYYNPREEDFKNLIADNLYRKWSSFYAKDCPYLFNIEPVKMRYLKERIIKYKGFVVKGHTGQFYLKADPKLLGFALQTGLGSKNSQGFGCIKQVLPKPVGIK